MSDFIRTFGIICLAVLALIFIAKCASYVMPAPFLQGSGID